MARPRMGHWWGWWQTWIFTPHEQRYKPAWDVKPIGRHGSRVQRRRARGRR